MGAICKEERHNYVPSLNASRFQVNNNSEYLDAKEESDSNNYTTGANTENMNKKGYSFDVLAKQW